MSWQFYIYLFLFIIVGTLIWMIVSTRNMKREVKEALYGASGFLCSREFIASDGGSGIGVDERALKVCLVEREGRMLVKNVFSFRDILSCEIQENGCSVYSKDRTSQLAGALLGGMLAGGVGAVIGGFSTGLRSSSYTTGIDLFIVVNDVSNPVFRINFFSGRPATGMFSGSLNTLNVAAADVMMKEAEEWCGIISVLIEKADAADRSDMVDSLEEVFDDSAEIEERLETLEDLKARGVITEEEYTSRRKNIISEI